MHLALTVIDSPAYSLFYAQVQSSQLMSKPTINRSSVQCQQLSLWSSAVGHRIVLDHLSYWTLINQTRPSERRTAAVLLAIVSFSAIREANSHEYGLRCLCEGCQTSCPAIRLPCSCLLQCVSVVFRSETASDCRSVVLGRRDRGKKPNSPAIVLSDDRWPSRAAAHL